MLDPDPKAIAIQQIIFTGDLIEQEIQQFFHF